jgi:hypothetical protein
MEPGSTRPVKPGSPPAAERANARRTAFLMAATDGAIRAIDAG